MLLSGSTAVTRSGRKPGQAGGGAVGPSPALPAFPVSAARIMSWNEARQPGLRAGTSTARRSSRGEGFGR